LEDYSSDIVNRGRYVYELDTSNLLWNAIFAQSKKNLMEL